MTTALTTDKQILWLIDDLHIFKQISLSKPGSKNYNPRHTSPQDLVKRMIRLEIPKDAPGITQKHLDSTYGVETIFFLWGRQIFGYRWDHGVMFTVIDGVLTLDITLEPLERI